MAAAQYGEEDGAHSDEPTNIITHWLCSRAQPQRSLRWTLALRAQQDLCAELMLMLRLALGHQSPFTPLARGATTVKEGFHDGLDGLHLLTRLLAEFGDPSMGLAFVSQVAGYVAEPVVASRLVPRLSFVGLRPSLQGIASLRFVPPLSLVGLQPSLQGIAPLRIPEMEPSAGQHGGIRTMPQLRLMGLRPTLHGCSCLGAPPAEEAALMPKRRSRRSRPVAQHLVSAPSMTRVTQSSSDCSIPHLCLNGLPPSLHGCSILGAPAEEEGVYISFPSNVTPRQHPTPHTPSGGSAQCVSQVASLAICIPIPEAHVATDHIDLARAVIPPLHLAGLRPSLHGCSGLGAPPSEQSVPNYVAMLPTGRTPSNVPRLYLGGLRPSLQGCSGLGAPPSEEVAAHYHTTNSGVDRGYNFSCSAHVSPQATSSTCPPRVSTCPRKVLYRRRSWCKPVPQLSLAGLRVSLQGCAGLGAMPPEAV